MGEQKNQNGQEQDINQLLKVRREKLADLQERGKDPFQITKFDVTHHSQEVKDDFDALEGKTVTIAGRMMSKRVMGKASFCNVQDLKGNIQCYVARDNVGEEEYKDFKKYDIGDIIGITGEVFRTKTGEISIHAANVTLLSKSLQILPEKFHGLTNTDVRYRQRYTDLIMTMCIRDRAQAILKVQQANADGLKMLKEASADSAVLQLKSLEAFAKAADGQATKIIIPSDIQGLAGMVKAVTEVAKEN